MTIRQSEELPPTHAVHVADDPYRLVIYQNDYYVSALLQQLLDIGLPVEEFRKTMNARLRSESLEGGGKAGGGLNLKFPGTAIGFTADASGDVRGTAGENNNDESERQLTTKFTQANYLHNVRRELAKRDLIRTVRSDADLQNLAPGQFIEYEATFRPNDLLTILELMNPEIVEAIVRQQHRKKAAASFDWEVEGHAKFQEHVERMKLQLDTKLELAVAITQAIKQDFRNSTSREYFGTISPNATDELAENVIHQDLTAITICDAQYFTGEDTDIILDGQYRVLGKVTEVSEGPESILKRNKLLNRVGEGALDFITEAMSKNQASEMFDTDLTLMIEGPILRVIPIAVYV